MINLNPDIGETAASGSVDAENAIASCHRVSHWFQVEPGGSNGEVPASAERGRSLFDTSGYAWYKHE